MLLACVQVVMAWINMCPESSTWSTLVEALTEVGHRKVAHEVAERRGEKKHKKCSFHFYCANNCGDNFIVITLIGRDCPTWCV